MNKKQDFDNVLTNLNKHEIRIENYLVQSDGKQICDEKSKFLAFQEPLVEIKEPKISIWEFLNEESVTEFLNLERKSSIRKYIDSKINKEFPKGKARTVFIELIYNVRKFCVKLDLNLEKTAAVLSQFYLTHLYFTSKFDVSAEKAYSYFKELALCHSLPFPPGNIKIFSLEETKEIMELFCKLYLRNIPLIRFLCLPNFAFYLNYELELEADLTAKTKKGKKKDKASKKGSSKGSKKGSKK